MNILQALIIAFCAILLFPPSSPAEEVDLKDLIRRVEVQYRGNSSHAIVRMEVQTGHWRRSLEMEFWSLRRDYFITRILKPPKEGGVATLKRLKEVWNYLPKVDRVIKIPPSMMGGSWMGSHITNDDLVKASHVDEDYEFELIEETDGTYRILCLPRPEAAVVWGKLIYEIEKEGVPVFVDYYDEAMVKVRTILFDEVRSISGRTIPLRMTVLPLDKPEEKTIMTYRDLAFDLPLTENYFSLRNLKGR